jgi:hypothetical protein
MWRRRRPCNRRPSRRWVGREAECVASARAGWSRTLAFLIGERRCAPEQRRLGAPAASGSGRRREVLSSVRSAPSRTRRPAPDRCPGRGTECPRPYRLAEGRSLRARYRGNLEAGSSAALLTPIWPPNRTRPSPRRRALTHSSHIADRAARPPRPRGQPSLTCR